MDETALKKCEACGGKVGELRRGRCWGCYLKWSEARPVGMGASCIVCGERRHDNLRMAELLGRSQPICHNCATRTFKLVPMPRSLEGIRERLERERRNEERRMGKRDHRIFARERRTGERRTDRDGAIWLADEFVVEIMDDAEPANDQGEQGELTRIHEMK